MSLLEEDSVGTGVPSEAAQPRIRLCCYIDSLELGGMATTVATLLSGLSPRFEVTVLGARDDVTAFVASARPGTDVRVSPPITRRTDFSRIARLLWAIRGLKPDVLLVNLGHVYASQYALLAALLSRTPTVAVVHAVLPHRKRRVDALFHGLLRRAGVTGAVSGYVAHAVEADLDLVPGSVRVLYGAVPEPETLAAVERRAAGELVVGGVGRCAPEKGFDILVRAIASVPDCRLVIAGDGPDLPALERLAKGLDVGDRVSFVGWVEPPWTTRLGLDILVAPSRAEGFGLAVAEAMQAGVPVVASRVGGLPEVVADGVTGVLVPTEDPEAVAAAINRLAKDPERRAAMGCAGRARVHDRFSMRAMTQSYEDAFDEARRQ